MSIDIRVMAKTDEATYRIIAIADDGSSLTCSCAGFNGDICSHIDAVLVARERAMVHPDDWGAADRAVALVGARMVIPAGWKGSWRKDFRWRGLSSRGGTRRVRDGSKPVVCFTGTLDCPRAKLIEEAMQNGWETINSPSPFTDVLVAADPLGNSGKLRAARKHGTPIVTREEWSTLMTDGVLPA